MMTTIFEYWASLETNFTGKTCTLEAETSVSGQTLCKAFIRVVKVIIEKQLKIVLCYFLKQLKNATDLLHQKGSAFRAVLEEVNRTLSIKVKINLEQPSFIKQLAPLFEEWITQSNTRITIEWIAYYLLINTYPLDSDLSGEIVVSTLRATEP